MTENLKITRRISYVIAVVLALISICYSTSIGSDEKSNNEIGQEKIKNSPNYEGGRFVNELKTKLISFKDIGNVIKEDLFPNKRRRPSQPLPIVQPTKLNLSHSDSLKVIWIGHATALVMIDSLHLLTDPVFETM